MRTDGPESSNIEDRRGRRMGGGRVVGGGIGVVLIAVVAMFFGIDPRLVLGLLGEAPQEVSAPAEPARPVDELGRFVSVVLADTERTWEKLFREKGRDYPEPKLVLFTGATPTACGTGQSATGPFYCPLDQKVYIDLAFYRQLRDRLGAPGDFAQAYVIAHEVGHHVQNQMGILAKVREAQQNLAEREANALQVRVELQADCFAGVWTHHANERRILEAGDIDEALNAAAAIGDDTLQKKAQGYAVPESFTHGSAQQRQYWFRLGAQTGRIEDCNTFDARR